MEIPKNVAIAINSVRESGITNMFDRRTVIRLIGEFDEDAANYLRENMDMYLDILQVAVDGKESWLND